MTDSSKVAVEILSWERPREKRKQIENDDEKQKKKQEYVKKIVLKGNFPQNGKQSDLG
jgi:hypothetical protein